MGVGLFSDGVLLETGNHTEEYVSKLVKAKGGRTRFFLVRRVGVNRSE